MKTVLITEPIHDAGMAILARTPGIEVIHGKGLSPADMATAVARSSAIATRTYALPGDLLSRANGLLTVAKHGVGCDKIDVAHCTSRGIPVMITASANKVSVAEHTMMLMLALAKDIVGYDRAVRTDNWAARYSLSAFELRNRTLLIVGFGRIGKEVAARARAFGMRVVLFDIAMDDAMAKSLGCEVTTDMMAALAEADIVTLHVPRNELSAGMMGEAQFANMKAGAVFLNCARGGLVDEAALVEALTSGHISRAGLDVFDDEPLPASSPFRSLPNVLLSPHSAASTQESGRQMAIDTVENILAVFAGKLDQANVFNPDYVKQR
jgi:D-3-phosphoglycerate dehydrogenase